MAASKTLIIFLSCVAIVLSQQKLEDLNQEFGDFTTRFVGSDLPVSGIGAQPVGVSPDGNFFAPGVRVATLTAPHPDPVPLFEPNLGAVGNAHESQLFPFDNIGGPLINDGVPLPFGGDLPFIPDERPGNIGPFPPPPKGDIKREVFVREEIDRHQFFPIGHHGPSEPIGSVRDAGERFRSSPVVYLVSQRSGGSVRDAAERFRSSPIVQVLSPASGGSGNRESEALKNIAPFIKPFTENIGKRYEPVFKEFPEIFLNDEGKDSCFPKIKKLFNKAYPKLPKLERANQPIYIPIPRLAKELPPNVLPTYVSLVNNGIVYAPYKISTTQSVIFVPFERKTKKLQYPAYPIYIPYVKLSLNVPEQRRQYFIYLPFQPDKNRAPSLTCAQSSVLLPIYGNPKEFFSVAAYNLIGLQESQGSSGAVAAPSLITAPSVGFKGPAVVKAGPVIAGPPIIASGPPVLVAGPPVIAARPPLIAPGPPLIAGPSILAAGPSIKSGPSINVVETPLIAASQPLIAGPSVVGKDFRYLNTTLTSYLPYNQYPRETEPDFDPYKLPTSQFQRKVVATFVLFTKSKGTHQAFRELAATKVPFEEFFQDSQGDPKGFDA
ncbi:uncharacterized protein LOC133190617 [Saccostrea echinata]|uniref:uncharacterized protein LOC133190617 n=1 Tax=Saccostrea echinata TaxID=191078 RepID=UPI002A826DD4|nr:uncharacterized protein LOC133190617 [Saccostrea echinata]